MRVKVESLQPSNLFEELDHDSIIAFIKPYMQIFNPWVVGYWILNFLIILFLALFLLTFDGVAMSNVLAKLGLGFFVFLVVLLPIHELLHGAAYKIVGAKKIIYKADFRKMVFYALADNFVADRREFTFVAMTPFAVINSILIVGVIALPPSVGLVLYGALILHTGGCYGDFALSSFFYEHQALHLVTYDSATERKTFFYRNANIETDR